MPRGQPWSDSAQLDRIHRVMLEEHPIHILRTAPLRLLSRLVPPRSPLRRRLDQWLMVPAAHGFARARLRWQEMLRPGPEATRLEARLRRSSRRAWRRSAREAETSSALDPATGTLATAARARLLFVLHAAEGGVWETTLDLLSAIHPRFECFLLTGRPTRLTLYRYSPRGLDPLETWWLAHPWSHRREHGVEHRRVYHQVLHRLKIDLVHVRHLLGHSDDLVELCAETQTPVVLSFHDFYMACPTIHLLDDQGRYCAGHCTPTRGQCRIAIDWLDDLPILKEGYLEAWRARVRRMLPRVSAFVTTSASSHDVLADVYPELAGRDFRIIEHGRDFAERRDLASPPRPGERVRLVVPGHIRFHKGSEFIRQLKSHDRTREDLLDLHFLGSIDRRLAGLGTHHGTYRRGELASRIESIRPSFVGIFSVWPETYSHTLTEAWAAGVPALVSDLGALKERVAAHGGGWTLPLDDVATAYEEILTIVRDPEVYLREARKARLYRPPTVARMGSDYERLYRDHLSGSSRSSEALGLAH